MSYSNYEIQKILLELTEANYIHWWSSQGHYFCKFARATIRVEAMYEMGHRAAIAGTLVVVKQGFTIEICPITLMDLLHKIMEQATPAIEEFHTEVTLEYTQYQSTKGIKGKDDGPPPDDRLYL